MRYIISVTTTEMLSSAVIKVQPTERSPETEISEQDDDDERKKPPQDFKQRQCGVADPGSLWRGACHPYRSRYLHRLNAPSRV